MDNGLKYALVTGASSGIGWHISIQLAERGYSILAVSNQPAELENLSDSIRTKFNVQVETLEADLSQPDSAQLVFDYCTAKNIAVEVLVNNAGILVYGEVLAVPQKKVSTILQLHMNTPVMLCRFFGARMKDQGHGFILNVSSISSVMPYPTISLYGPSKTFLRKFTRALRTENMKTGVTVSCLLPGATATALYDPNKVNLPLAQKLGVMKKPKDVARSGLKALFRNKAECVPGFINKLAMLVVPMVPQALIGWVYRKEYFVK